jgi:hypothetical protein
VEADWSAEIGEGLPVIDADWPGFVDLREDGLALAKIPEALAEPALHAALTKLNRPPPVVFTSKCDVWNLAADEMDVDEFGCTSREACIVGMASWIDVIAQDPHMFGSFAGQEAWVRRTAERLRTSNAPCGRVDLVVRAAIAGAQNGFGITLYAAGCGCDSDGARAAWEQVLSAAVAATMREVRASSSIG